MSNIANQLENREIYELPEIWDPSNSITPELDKAVEAYNLSNGSIHPDLASEIILARNLTQVSDDLFRGHFKNSIYRAELAQYYGYGNCIAHTEAVVATGLAKGLDMYVSWDGMHATSIFAGRIALWDVDGQAGSTVKWMGHKYNDDKDEDEYVSIFNKVGREIIESGGRAFIEEDVVGNISWEPIVGRLGDNESDLYKPTIFLPGYEGLKFLLTYADMIRYIRTNSEKALLVSDQIMNYLPKTETANPYNF